MPLLELERVPEREQLLYRSEAPAAHGYGRGDLLGVFAKVEGELDAVGYGHVTQVRGQTVELLATFLPDDHRAGALWMGPLPEDEHLGHRIGRVLDSPDTGRFYIDVGQADGVRLGDTYRVFDGVINDANFDARTLQKRPVGLLQVVKADEGKVVSLAVLLQGKAPRGAWVELIDARDPETGMLDQRQRITVLILHLVGDRLGGESENDPQRLYWKKLHDVLLVKEIGLGDESLLRLVLAERQHAVLDGGQTAIVEVGQDYGADIVLWGSVQCTSSEACVRPNVTFVNQEKFGDEARVWSKRVGAKSDLVGLNDDVGGVDESIRGLASWLAGVAYFEAMSYRNALFHLENVPLDPDLDVEWASAQGLIFYCSKVLGDVAKAEGTARLEIEYGRVNKMHWYEARGHADLGFVLHSKGFDKEALDQFERAKELAQNADDPVTLIQAWGGISNVFKLQGDLNKALEVLVDKRLPIAEALGVPHYVADTWMHIAAILARRGDLDKALDIYKNEVLAVFEKLREKRPAAIAWLGVADVLEEQGKEDEALRIFEEEVVPVLEEIGDVRELAMARSRIARILAGQGKTGKALEIYKKEVLPAFTRLEDEREIATTWGHIASSLFMEGDFKEALRIRREIVLPAFERLGDAEGVSATWTWIANVTALQGNISGAIGIYDLRVLPSLLASDSRVQLVRSRYMLSKLLLARNAPGDRERARMLLKEALDDARVMRLQGDVATILEIVEDAGF